MRCWKFSGPFSGRKGQGVVAPAVKRSEPLHFPSHRIKGWVPKSCRLTCRGRSGARAGADAGPGRGRGGPSPALPVGSVVPTRRELALPPRQLLLGSWRHGPCLLDARAPVVLRRASRSLIRRSKHLKASRSYHCSQGRASDSIMNLLSGVVITMFYL